jgi:hypothetical protein
LIQDYPDVRLLYTDTIDQALRKVSIGEAEATMDNLAVMSQQISRLGLTNLKIAAPTEYRSEMRMGVRTDFPELRWILDKALEFAPACSSAPAGPPLSHCSISGIVLWNARCASAKRRRSSSPG